jgi:hypothetical protein
MLARTVSSNSTVSWVTTPISERRLASFMSRTSMPSMVRRPSTGSKKRGRRLTSVDLPAPEGPTRATISPLSISRSTSSSTGWSS